MSDIPAIPTRQAAAIEGRSGRLKVTGKLAKALELMIWQGIKRADAAARAGLADNSLKAALKKPHVLAFYNAEMAALRTSLRPRNVHRLDEIGDQRDNKMAAVAAIKALENITEQADQNQRPGTQTVPGMIIVIQNGTAAPKVIDHAPIASQLMPNPSFRDQ